MKSTISKFKEKIQQGKKNSSPAGPAGDYDIYHIGVLDGIRAVAVSMVAWFHIWQQSWLMPVTESINLDWLVRNGALFVDMMILLSGFCLFLPHARHMILGEQSGNTREFYWKRVARIAPTYFFCILVVLFVFAIPQNEYGGNISFMIKDVLTHVTFTHNLFSDVMEGTKLNGVLWTVGVEVQFYLIFPLLALWFRKKPLVTYAGMVAVGALSCYWISSHFDSINHMLYLNHTLTFFGVYANGMLGAWLYVWYANKRQKRTWQEGVIGIVLAIGGIVAYRHMCEWRSGMEGDLNARWQVDNRFLLSVVFLIIVFGTMISMKWFRKIWDNKVMVFLAGISFNLYICHQYIAVRFKILHLPAWNGDWNVQEPSMAGDKPWQWKFTILCIVVSLAVAIFMTYCIERPIAKWILKKIRRKRT